ncbi:serine/threonine kinase family protein, partial [Plesiocystis pacifica SIR-1]
MPVEPFVVEATLSRATAMNATREPSLGDTPEYAPTQDSAERRTDPPHRPESSFEHRRAVAAARKALFGQAQELFIGRYRILNRIGAGGMGEVYLAQDEKLERRVAIKRVLGAGVNDRAQERLRREARALARLSHPNVVQVYEIGEHEERTFLAMEFVEGQTLAAWLESEAHDWRAILTQFIDAGRGLAAVHAVGVVHRDFKAENVLMGKDGRARIADFGLAIDDGAALPEAPQGPEAPENPEAARADGSESSAASGPRPLPSLGERLSVTGAMVGTIRYMAPEQIRAGHIDARSDQFAF